MIASVSQASEFLGGLLSELYRRSAGGAGTAGPFHMALIDDPLVARRVLTQHDVFVKNYGFLNDFAKGRFSANGAEWRQRAASTQPWYRSVHKALDMPQLGEIYTRHLAQGDVLDATALYVRLTDAAVEVFSRSIGLSAVLPWPDALLEGVRCVLKVRQWIDWHGCTQSQLQAVQADIAVLREELRTIWQDSAPARAALAQLEPAHGAPVPEGFDAVQELIQNLLASSETTASSMLWAAEALGSQPKLQQALAQDRSGVERFMAEVLRMFPPVPYLTRRCAVDTELAGQPLAAGSVLSVSIVGVHRNPVYWRQPHLFDMMRPEYDQDATPVAYMPFSRGPRVCTGMRLAQMEIRAGLDALLTLRECVPGSSPTRFGYGLSSRPLTGLRAILRQG